jgi:solute carrier family 25 protein 33/36
LCAEYSLTPLVLYSVGAIVSATSTAPLDVLRTRLQSDYYQSHLVASRLARGIADPSTLSFSRSATLHIRETFQILFAIPRVEGWRALFKGLGANLVAIVPARGIHFFAYGNSKTLLKEHVTHGKEGPLVHLGAAGLSGVITGTITNPIWVIKTRLQLDKSQATGGAGRKYRSAMDCLFQTVRAEGIRGLYRGLSASFLGISESSMQWVMYEEGKRRLRLREARLVESGQTRTWTDDILGSFGDSIAAGGAKFIAAFLTYPHEVRRRAITFKPAVF